MDSGPPRDARSYWVLAATAILVAQIVLGQGTSDAVSRAPRTPRPVAIGQPAPTPMSNATGVSCGDPEHCVVVGLAPGSSAAIATTSDGGVRWFNEPIPASVSALGGVSCLDRLDCLAVGSSGTSGAVLSTLDGGKSWILTGVPTDAAVLTAVQCLDQIGCLVLATDGMSYWSVSTNDGGKTWSRGGTLPAGMTAEGMSCLSASQCLAVGFVPTGPGQGSGAIATTSNGGGSWTAATLPAGSGILRTVACSTQRCFAAGTNATATTGFVAGSGELLISSDEGATWHLVAGSIGPDDAFAASCPSTHICVVVGTQWVGKAPPDPTSSVMTTMNGGNQWRPAILRYVALGMAAVACPIVNRCIAGGGNELVRLKLAVPPPSPRPRTGGRAGPSIH